MNQEQEKDAALSALKKDFYKSVKKEPKKITQGGKVMVRMDKSLHDDLKDRAKAAGKSLNAYCMYLLFLKPEGFPLESPTDQESQK